MFELYDQYYSGAKREIFESDLADKSQVLLLKNDRDALRGFSTIKVYEVSDGERMARVIYSGDTIIDRDYWGTQALPFRWIENAGRIKAANPEMPLYWLLITKGHRTYRYLPAFARTFYPTWRADTPCAMQRLMEATGHLVFGNRYDAASGIVRHEPEGVALRRDFAGLDGRNRANREVGFFLERNPGHAEGDELLCMCELSEANLRPMARTQFLRGYDEEQLAKTA